MGNKVVYVYLALRSVTGVLTFVAFSPWLLAADYSDEAD